MIIMALLYGANMWPVRATAVLLIGAVFLAVSPSGWAGQAAVTIGLKEPANENIIYKDETNYCYVAVKVARDNPAKRLFFQDKLVHSEILLTEPNRLQYPYEQIMAAVTHRFASAEDKPFF
jgi:hypothetical protein